MNAKQAKYPQLRFKGFTDPWEERKLVSMTNYKNGKGHEDKQSTIGKLELINLNSISISGGLKHSGKFIDEADDTLQKDDLVMILSDVGHGDLLGRVALIPEDDRFVLNQRVALLRPNATADPQFLFSYINAHQYYFKAQGAGMSQLNISKGSVENFISFVPIIEEQKKIGTFFKQLDNTITLHQRKLAKLKELKQGYLQKMFPKNGSKFPQLRFSGFADAWEQRNFGELYKKNLERNKDQFSSDRTISIATMRFKKEGNGAAEDSLVSYKVLREGDIAFEGHTSKRFAFGRFVLNDIGDGIMSPRFTTLRPTQDMPIKFWKQYIHYEPIMRYPIVNSTKLGTMMNELVVDEFLNQPVLVPELSEQQKIGSFFKQLDGTITLHQRKLEKLQELKKGYLQKMFC
ncbi:restriction endonuclease subunit S (plasmid) [Levilactobacillus brevis]|uniref:restriction endonuclease subunit S n=1 Tax=Levilactobacillus wangkuiensis TaxID=2799566 RepID=UPI0019418D80|nr:restriction endonuclease subunit S [Levilactobacillus wangkuiensis]UIF30399.1 restriction endonuclease subunit S [Levilactobacillus brevis]